jgi:spermidine/putrescine transport system substrate-binding protein
MTDLEDRLQKGINRRELLKLLAASGVVLTGPLGRIAYAADELRYDGFGGTTAAATDKYALDPFKSETGINVVHGTFSSQRDMLTKVRAGQTGDYHILHMSGLDWYKRYVDLGYTSELDESLIPNLKWIMPPLVDAFRKITPKALAAVPFAYGTSGIAYNTKFVSREEVASMGPAILLSEKYAGKLTGGNDAQARVWYGALQSGQDPNNIQNIEKVWDKARESKKLVKKYWTSGAEQMELFAKEEVIIGDAWSGRVAQLQDQGFPIGYYEMPGVPAWIEGLMVLKGAPKGTSEKLLNFMLNPAVAGGVAEGQKYPPALDPTKVTLSEAVKKIPAFDPSGKLDRLRFPEPAYWAEKLDGWEKQWNRVSKGA